MHERSEFDWMLEAEIPHLRRYARSLVGDASAADDLVQSCLERAMRKWQLWRGHARLRSWLFRMLYRVYLNQKRDARRHHETVSIDAVAEPVGPGNAGASVVALHELMAGLAMLPTEQRDAITLLALEDLSYEDAAWVLSIPVGTLRSRVSRGREQLRRFQSAEPTETAPTALRRVK